MANMITAYLRHHPCIDCGEADPVVLEFDHRNPALKAFSLGEACQGGYAPKTVSKEIAKCDVRCANCHRRKTYKERGFTHRSEGGKQTGAATVTQRPAPALNGSFDFG